MSIAQLLRAQAMGVHPQKSAQVWAIRVSTATTAGTVFSQPVFEVEDTVISPIEEEVGEREALFVGHNIMAGDLKLKLPGTLDINEQTELVCDGQAVDIKKLDRFYQRGVIQEYRLYVTRRREA